MSRNQWPSRWDRVNGGDMQLPWMSTVKVGDVLVSGKGTMRVARRVSRYQNGKLRGIAFTIRRCSWTGSAFTFLGFTDLRYQGYEPIGVNLPMRTALDRKLADDMDREPLERQFTCCDVEAIP